MPRLRPTIDEPTLIAYYCRTCEKIVKAEPKGGRKKYSFRCPECKEDCIYGTARALIHFLRIKEASDNGQALLALQREKRQSLEEKSKEKNATKEY